MASDVDRVDLRTRAAEWAILIGDSPAAVRLRRGRARATTEAGRPRAALLERLGSVHFLAGDARPPRWPSARRWPCSRRRDQPAGGPPVRRLRADGCGLVPDGGAGRRPASSVPCASPARSAPGVRRAWPSTLWESWPPCAATWTGAWPAPRVARRSRRRWGVPTTSASAYVNLSHVLGFAGAARRRGALARAGIAELTRYGQDRQSGLAAVQRQRRAGQGRPTRRGGGADHEALGRQPRGMMAAPVLLLAARLGGGAGRPDHRLGPLRAGPAGHRVRGRPAGLAAGDHRDRGGGRALGGAARVLPPSWSPTAWRRSRAPTRRFGTKLVALVCARWRTRRLPTGTTGRDPREQRPGTELRRSWATRSRPERADLPETEALDLLCAAERARLGPRRRGRPVGTGGGGLGARGRPFPAAYARWRRPRRCSRAASARGRSRAARRARERPAARRRPAGRGDRDDGHVVPSGPASACRRSATDAGTEALAAYALTSREREVLAALAAGPPTRRSRTRSSSASRPPQCTSPTSCASSTCRAGRTQPGSRTGSA